MPFNLDWKVIAAVGVPAIAIAIFAALLQAFNIPFSNIPAPWLAAIIILIVLTFSFVVYYALKRWSPETSIKPDLSKFQIKEQRKLAKKHKKDINQLETTLPSDDPMMRKQYGIIAARPSEFLIITDNSGNVDPKRSGPGKSFYKYPWRTNRNFAIIPMTVKTIDFTHNVTTLDGIEVSVRGTVSYRISDPLTVYDKVNFNNRETGELKVINLVRNFCSARSEQAVGGLSHKDATANGPRYISDLVLDRLIDEGVFLGEKSPMVFIWTFLQSRVLNWAMQN